MLQEAENMKLRSASMMALDRHIQSLGWTQGGAAAQIGVTQPRISDLKRGKSRRFNLDKLVEMVSAPGPHIHVQVDEAARNAGRHCTAVLDSPPHILYQPPPAAGSSCDRSTATSFRGARPVRECRALALFVLSEGTG